MARQSKEVKQPASLPSLIRIALAEYNSCPLAPSSDRVKRLGRDASPDAARLRFKCGCGAPGRYIPAVSGRVNKTFICLRA